MAGLGNLRYSEPSVFHGGDDRDATEDEILDFDHSAVDFDHLQRFTMGNRSLEEEVLNLFRSNSASQMQKLREARDDRAWHEAAHTLKGSAAGIGAHRVREAAAECERLDGSDRLHYGPISLARLDRAVGEANLLIAKFLND